jgi:hypothetical protein
VRISTPWTRARRPAKGVSAVRGPGGAAARQEVGEVPSGTPAAVKGAQGWARRGRSGSEERYGACLSTPRCRRGYITRGNQACGADHEDRKSMRCTVHKQVAWTGGPQETAATLGLRRETSHCARKERGGARAPASERKDRACASSGGGRRELPRRAAVAGPQGIEHSGSRSCSCIRQGGRVSERASGDESQSRHLGALRARRDVHDLASSPVKRAPCVRRVQHLGVRVCRGRQ